MYQSLVVSVKFLVKQTLNSGINEKFAKCGGECYETLWKERRGGLMLMTDV